MLPFSAPLLSVARQILPWVEPGPYLAAWCARPGAGALVSDGGPQGRFSYFLGEADASADLGATDDAASFLKAATAFVSQDKDNDLPPFTGGLVGVAGF